MVMNCSVCGDALSEGSLFCESCGADLRGQIAPRTVSGSGGTAAAQQTISVRQPVATPSPAAFVQLGGELLKSMSLGEKLAGIGAVAATLGFFLPWVTGPDIRSLGNLLSLGNLSELLGRPGGPPSASFSGLDVARLWGGVYLILLAGIASGVLFMVSRRASFARKLRVGGFQVMIGSMIGPLIIAALLFVPFIQSVAGTGLWLLGLGFCCVIAGALVTLSELGRLVR